ncbi:MAG: penicillin-insensitive murein endopeptidase, partial [Hyphomicrobiales bacterium]
WGHPRLIAYIDKLSKNAAAVGWNGVLVGDMAQPRGGPMPGGHRSHQIGLDADIWLTQMPDRKLTFEERKTLSAKSMLDKTGKAVDPSIWTPKQQAFLKAAASIPEVARIFVNPAIKVALCNAAGSDRGWLRKIRPWWGHKAHFHVRLSCPPGVRGCKNQAAPRRGDGCGAELASWFKPPPKVKKGAKKHKAKKRRELVMADLPKACMAVLNAE